MITSLYFKAQALDNSSEDHYHSGRELIDLVETIDDKAKAKLTTMIHDTVRFGKLVAEQGHMKLWIQRSLISANRYVLQVPAKELDRAGRIAPMLCFGTFSKELDVEFLMEVMTQFAELIGRHTDYAVADTAQEAVGDQPQESKQAGAPINNLERFQAIVSKYCTTISNQIEVGATDYLDKPVEGVLFRGYDRHSRAFINIPVTVRHYNRGVENVEMRAFTVFQRYTTNNNNFVLGSSIASLNNETFLGCGEKVLHFTKLEQLLNKEPIKIKHIKYEEGTISDDEDNYIVVELAPSTTEVSPLA